MNRGWERSPPTMETHLNALQGLCPQRTLREVVLMENGTHVQTLRMSPTRDRQITTNTFYSREGMLKPGLCFFKVC